MPAEQIIPPAIKIRFVTNRICSIIAIFPHFSIENPQTQFTINPLRKQQFPTNLLREKRISNDMQILIRNSVLLTVAFKTSHKRMRFGDSANKCGSCLRTVSYFPRHLTDRQRACTVRNRRRVRFDSANLPNAGLNGLLAERVGNTPSTRKRFQGGEVGRPNAAGRTIRFLVGEDALRILRRIPT